MLGNQLRRGSAHCNCEGTIEWFEQTLRRAEAVAPEDTPRLVVTDAGHDATENLRLFARTPDTDFIVKRNLRRQDPTEWLAAQRNRAGPEGRIPPPAAAHGPKQSDLYGWTGGPACPKEDPANLRGPRLGSGSDESGPWPLTPAKRQLY